ncbi:hypothetical protein [Ferrovum myxofaciens]|uniref:Uncharacterized protein n=1 Tax=Ferrovum myxofaciens TaxID=416213 RepID=A0A9E6MZ37_9PROT|nr:hypothetical protein [Ferrovum myxofaciens]QWY75173.1 MAG: hypothetical protein JVY19_01620 [Ferrovum myxofaciens]QWY77906.1 MAG: hypothetical protein JZL65_02115 [Ferrovum myxofaciens]
MTAIGSLLSVPFAIPQTAIASLLPDVLSWVQRQVSELSGRLARQPTDWSSARTAIEGVLLERQLRYAFPTFETKMILFR